MYQAKFGSCSQCGECVHGKSRETTLQYNQIDFKYLKGTMDYGITFVKQKGDLSVVGYVDAY
jgi:hypothetical protein